MNKSKKYKSKIKYQNVTVTVITDRPIRRGICEACKRRVGKELKVTQLHHWKYAFKPETVKDNPELALLNTTEYCFGCHPIADALRTLTQVKDKYRVLDILDTLPPFIIERFNNLIRLVVNGNRYEGSGTDRNNY